MMSEREITKKMPRVTNPTTTTIDACPDKSSELAVQNSAVLNHSARYNLFHVCCG